jgi:ribosome-binding protein aMBF1 (putative translation factor)
MFRTPLPSSRNHRKPLPVSIQTHGDLIQIKRYEKRLTLWQLAQKMGITTASVRAWENGTRQPNGQQIALLTKHLGFALGERSHTLADAQQYPTSLLRRL